MDEKKTIKGIHKLESSGMYVMSGLQWLLSSFFSLDKTCF